jgi:hypothetical protein
MLAILTAIPGVLWVLWMALRVKSKPQVEKVV